MILGKTGSGKSSIGNTIFKEDKFTVCHKSISALSPCQAKTKSLNGREITLIDTPGFFDTNKPEEKLKPELVKCITECSPGLHAFLILLKLERFTKQENDVINQITQFFSDEVFKFATVVFTHGDDLQEGLEIKDYVRDNQCLTDLVKKCGGRCHVIDNKYWKNPSDDPYRSNTHQVEEILKSVEEIVKANNGNCYTNEMLEKVEKMIQQKEELIALSSGNMSKEEIWQKAKGIVCDILNKAAGITTGALLGAFFGVAVAVVAVVAVIKIVANTIMTTTKKAETTTGKASCGISGPDIETIAARAITVAVCAPKAATVGVTAGAMWSTVVAGAGVGAYEGYQAAKESETPWEAMNKTAEAMCSTGNDAI
ncbi:GTPase IMAP family member 7-like [Gambusia affinis]|uniref:GTPase IMAP family member 7-like n=1 Tax=Gambusia affinis TaxID=33528 RepID=UPI001CDD4922|nr:GTPase IMAP family member 7-like [Gambusia affinis]